MSTSVQEILKTNNEEIVYKIAAGSYIGCGVSACSVAQARCLRYLGLTMYPFLLLPIEPDPNQNLGGAGSS